MDKRKNSKGFTLIEVLASCVIITVVVAVAFQFYSNAEDNFEETNLNKDVRSLNTAVELYKTFGGNLDGVSTPQDVLRKLQSRADAASSEQVAGLTGNLIDKRMRVELLSHATASSTETPRAVWDPQEQKFFVTRQYSDDHVPIAKFEIDWSPERIYVVVNGTVDESPADGGDADPNAEPNAEPGSTEYYTESGQVVVEEDGVEGRNSNLKLAIGNGWIWDYNENSTTALTGPTPVLVSSDPGYTAPTSSGGTTTPGTTTALSPPVFSVSPGDHPVTDFDLNVALSNPNPAGSSRMVYVIGGSGGWTSYDAPIDVIPGMRLTAYAESIQPGIYSNSIEESGVFLASDVTLGDPAIQVSSTAFDFDTNQTVSVSIGDPNDASYSTPEYQLNAGGWQTYTGPFNVVYSDYPDGLDVEARAVATPPRYPEYYIDSGVSAQRITEAIPTRLDAPDILFSAEKFDETLIFISVAMSNPNPGSVSTVYYQVTPAPGTPGVTTSFAAYDGSSFLVSSFDYPGGFGIRAYSKSTALGFLDSVVNERITQGVDEGMQGGHFDVDTTSYISNFPGGGSTDGHIHEYDKKFNLTGVDFFNTLENKLHEITDDISAMDQKFKIIVANADLSPGGRLVVNSNYSGNDRGSYEAVTDYDGTPAHELPVYSLGGVDGTIPLSGLGLYFGEWAIASAGILPTNTPAVRKNVPGKNGEWRNGALTVQVVAVNADGSDAFTLEPAWSSGGHGVATSGLLYEATFFWHWGGRDYDNGDNTYVPGDQSTVATYLTGGNNGHGNNEDGVDVSNPGNSGGDDTSAPVDDETSNGGGSYDYGQSTCPPNGLIAEYAWNETDNRYDFVKGKFENAISWSNVQYLSGWWNRRAISADFSSTVFIDAVEVWTAGLGKDLDTYNPPVSDGTVSSSDPNNMITKVRFYCYYNGAYIGTGESTITGGSGTDSGGSTSDPESYVLPGPSEPWVVLLDPDALGAGISSVAAATAAHGLGTDDLLGSDSPITGDGGNPFNLWNETYYGDELWIPGGLAADAGWFSVQSDALDEQAFIEGTLPGTDLSAVQDVVALDNTALSRLIGRSVVGIVYDYDLSIDATNNNSADLSGDRFGRFAFTVLGVDPPGTLTESTDPTSLWDVRIRVDSPYATPFDNIDTYTVNWLPAP